MNEKRQQLLPVFLEAWQRQKLCLRKNRKSSSILSSGLRILQQSLSIQISFFRSHLQAKLERYGKTMKSWQTVSTAQPTFTLSHLSLLFAVQCSAKNKLLPNKLGMRLERWRQFFLLHLLRTMGDTSERGMLTPPPPSNYFSYFAGQNFVVLFLNKVKRGRFLFKNTQQKDWSALQTNRQTNTHTHILFLYARLLI